MMHETGPLTTASGALVADSRNSEPIGVGGTPPLRERVLPAAPVSPRREHLAPARHVSAWAAATPVRRNDRRACGRTGRIRRRAAQAVYVARYAGYAARRRAV
ncbi:hypothetical protein ACPCUV_27405 [Streptomyces platensis]|uniref:hypothetical protein n=1 Tax=Streptomyces platensis TaxID=58346 RepID=UPI003C2B6A31